MDEIKKFAAVFPGQASQYVGMGKEFVDNVEGCAEILKIGEKITGLPLTEKIMNGPMEDLTRTSICQPAIFGISMVCWHVFSGKGFSPCSAAGHSLGEYSALAAAKAMTLEEGYYIVKQRASIMDKISQEARGGLLAVLGLKLKDLENMLGDFPGVEISNINSSVQVVVGGSIANLEKFNLFLRSRKIKGVMLKVSGPFHTSLMQEAADKLQPELEKIDWHNPEIPVYMNCSGEKVSGAGEIKQCLVKQLCSPVRWLQTIENIAREDSPAAFVEIGPKKVLKKLIEGISPGTQALNVEDSESMEAAAEGLKIRGDGD